MFDKIYCESTCYVEELFHCLIGNKQVLFAIPEAL